NPLLPGRRLVAPRSQAALSREPWFPAARLPLTLPCDGQGRHAVGMAPRHIDPSYWSRVEGALGSELTQEELVIVHHLQAGLTQPVSGGVVGLHRSAVWRRIQEIRRRADLPRPAGLDGAKVDQSEAMTG